ncbi:MAG: helix-turn-helix transcriptional regulator [Gammaproteobacteria bacterium]|nr:helix-turn-helix transcriptional regulator [Gammaproteobacteria bacterium]
MTPRHRAVPPAALQPRGRYLEDKRSFVDTSDGDGVSVSLRTAVAPARGVPYRFEHPLVCLTNVGAIRFSTASGASTRHAAGDILLIPAGEPVFTDYLAPSAAAPLACTTLELDNALVTAVADRLGAAWPDGERYAALYTVESIGEFVDEATRVCIRQLDQLLRTGFPVAHREHLVELASAQLVTLLLQSNAREALLARRGAVGDASRLGGLVAYIAANLAGDLDVTALAARCYMSVATFHRHFVRRFGCPPARFVLDARLREAARRLRADPAVAVAEVARATGFGSAAHFSTMFRRRFRMSPRAWRAAARPAGGVADS